jgi:biotin carboxylase
VEYGVVLAAALAEEWGLPGAGLAAARTFRDKASLRARVATTGIAQPAWALVAGPEEVERFRARHGVDCVLKPANRQASVGVQILGADHDARSAWPHTALAGEPRLRARDRGVARVLVEERLRGPEVSVETLVQDGATRLVNVTGKTVQRSRFPVELGHTVPADLPAGTIHELIASTRDLVTVTGFRCGILHAEWILVDGRPHLVECAARLPGDGIVTLIDLAYGGSLVRGLLDVLAGETPAPARTAIGGSAIRFLVAEPGTVTSIDGEDAARSLSGVHEVHIGVSPGGTVGTTTNSWDRAGHVIATGADGPAAARLAERAAALIRIRTEAPARAGGGG